MTTELGDMVFLPVVLHWEGIRALLTIFPSSWKFVKPDHLDFDPEPCRAGLPQVPTGADPTHSRCGVLIDPVSLRGFSHQQELGWIVLLMWLQGVWAGGAKESEFKPQLPEIFDWGICAFLCLNFFIYGWRAGGDRGADTGLVLSPSVQELMHRPVLPQQHHLWSPVVSYLVHRICLSETK